MDDMSDASREILGILMVKGDAASLCCEEVY
jgi:hypothetical protein